LIIGLPARAFVMSFPSFATACRSSHKPKEGGAKMIYVSSASKRQNVAVARAAARERACPARCADTVGVRRAAW